MIINQEIEIKDSFLTVSLDRLSASLENIYKILRLRKPGMVFVKVLSEGENGMLVFVLKLPAKAAADVVAREVVYSVAGADPVVLTLGGDELVTGEMSAQQDEVVAGTLVDIDDAGNRSDAREFSFTMVDTFAPPAPGDVGVEIIREE